MLVQKELKKIYIWSNATPRLPSAYQEVEYIQSSGTQYIDTGYIPNWDTRVEFEFFDKWSANWVWFWSYANSSSWTDRSFWLYQNNNSWSWQFFVHYSSNTGVSVSPLRTSGTIVLDKWNLSIDWVSVYTTQTLSFTWYQTMYFLSWHWSSTQNQPMPAKIKYVKISEDWTPIRNYVPCYRISDGVIWLYDLINDVFYTNAGSWTFSKWADANLPYKEINKVYLGSTQVRPSWWGRQPWANTIAYYPLKWDLNDYSGNGYNLTNSGGVLSNIWWIDCVYYDNWTSSYNNSIPAWATRTLSARIYKWEIPSHSEVILRPWWWTRGRTGVGVASDGWVMKAFISDYSTLWINSATGISTSTRTNIVWIVESTNMYLYVNWVLEASWTRSYASTSSSWFILGKSDTQDDNYKWYVNNVIFEDKARTAQEVLNYYNQTKWNYWIS